MSFTSGVITDSSLIAAAEGFDLDIHIPWYRSLPLSSLLELQVAVDGTRIPSEDLRITVNDEARTLAEMAEQWQEFWFIQDTARVHVRGTTPIAVGDQAEITVRADLRIPYIFIAPDTPLINSVTATRTLTANTDEEITP